MRIPQKGAESLICSLIFLVNRDIFVISLEQKISPASQFVSDIYRQWRYSFTFLEQKTF